MDKNTNFPEYLTIYDEKGNEKLNVTYSNFRADAQVSSDIFKTE